MSLEKIQQEELKILQDLTDTKTLREFFRDTERSSKYRDYYRVLIQKYNMNNEEYIDLSNGRIKRLPN